MFQYWKACHVQELLFGWWSRVEFEKQILPLSLLIFLLFSSYFLFVCILIFKLRLLSLFLISSLLIFSFLRFYFFVFHSHLFSFFVIRFSSFLIPFSSQLTIQSCQHMKVIFNYTNVWILLCSIRLSFSEWQPGLETINYSNWCIVSCSFPKKSYSTSENGLIN